MKTTDDWLSEAMTDETVVVELLLRLKQAPATTPSVIPLRWGLRLPRSRSSKATKKIDGGDSSTRCSPITPLSWSSGREGSSSPTTDGFEETSRHSVCPTSSSYIAVAAVRSKGIVTSENTSAFTKRSRKKRTISELKEEEGFLLKEKSHLKKELTSLRTTFLDQRSKNENLKRIKDNLSSSSAKNLDCASQRTQKTTSGRLSSRDDASSPKHLSSGSISHPVDDSKLKQGAHNKQAESNHDKSFVVPDLNMMPTEEDTAC